MNTVMKDFTNDLGFTVAFLIGALLINVTFGSRVLYSYLVLVLLSMVVINSAKLKNYIGRVTHE